MEKNLAARKADYEKARAKYEPLISSPKERELAAELEKLWQVFVKSAEDVQTLGAQGRPRGGEGDQCQQGRAGRPRHGRR